MKNENSLKTTNITAEQQAFNDMLKNFKKKLF